MDINNYSEILHYRRGLRSINKLDKLFEDGKYDTNKEQNFYINEMHRIYHNEIGCFDVNNFLFLCTVALLGLNKEAIENSGNNKNYQYDIAYNKSIEFISNDPNKELIVNVIKNKEEEFLSQFSKERIIKTPYDKWLSINKLNNIPGYNYNFLFNIRNAMMHSEYNYEIQNQYSSLVINVNNSNYTNFSAKIYLPYYCEFIKHYFSNDVFLGLVSNMIIIDIPNTNNQEIKNRNDLQNYLTNEIQVKKWNYNNSLKQNKIFEKYISKALKANGGEIYKEKINNYNIKETDITVSSNDINQIILIIESYYKDVFYNLNLKDQRRIISSAVNYKFDPKSAFSMWIMHFYREMTSSLKGMYVNDDFTSLFALKPSIQLLKSYIILYRIQNKKLLQNELNYDLIDDFEYINAEDDYNDYKQLLMKQGIIDDEKKYKIFYFLNVFRNALCHGNVEMIMSENNDQIQQQFCFSDIYKNRKREIIISTENLQKFLNSEAFASKFLKYDEQEKCDNNYKK